MHRLLGIFTDPYPIEDDRRIQFLQSLLISVVVVAVLFVFKPFGLADVNLPVIKLIPVYIGYGLVTLVACLVADRLIRPAFPSFFDDQRWNVAKHIFWTIITIMIIGLGNLFYSKLLGFTGISGTSLLTFQLYTIAVAIIPVTLVTLLRRIRLLTKSLKEAREINLKLKLPVTAPMKDTPLVFASDNGKDSMELRADQFLFAESADNYTDIVYIENAIIRRALIRSSLKKIEEMNSADFVVRVHRAFLVNIRKVKQVVGNSQGYRLIFDNVDESVPVARRTSSAVKQLLAQVHGS